MKRDNEDGGLKGTSEPERRHFMTRILPSWQRVQERGGEGQEGRREEGRVEKWRKGEEKKGEERRGREGRERGEERTERRHVEHMCL